MRNGVQLEKFHVVLLIQTTFFLYIWTNPSVNFGYAILNFMYLIMQVTTLRYFYQIIVEPYINNKIRQDLW